MGHAMFNQREAFLTYVNREFWSRYPAWKDEPGHHPAYRELCAEMADYLNDQQEDDWAERWERAN